MNKPDHAASSTLSDFLRGPMAQGSAVGLLTLIPVRNYPRWVRQSIMWGPIVIAGFGAAYLGANPGMAKTLSKQAADTEEPKQSEFDELSEHAPESKSAGGLSGAVRALVPGVAIGAVMSGSMAAAIWADEKIDRGLRRIGIPFPRSVMGVAAGALTWWSVTTENEWDRSKENDRFNSGLIEAVGIGCDQKWMRRMITLCALPRRSELACRLGIG